MPYGRVGNPPTPALIGIPPTTGQMRGEYPPLMIFRQIISLSAGYRIMFNNENLKWYIRVSIRLHITRIRFYYRIFRKFPIFYERRDASHYGFPAHPFITIPVS
jgi:hypothetical protein